MPRGGPRRPSPPSHGEVVAGRNPVLEVLRSGRSVLRVYLTDEARREGSVQEILHLAAERGVGVHGASPQRIAEMAAGARHQGVAAVCEARGYARVEDLLEAAKARGEDPFVLLLDGVEDPHNLGAILRVADGAGAHGVVVAERGAVGLTPGVYKASAGAAEFVPVARVANLMDAVTKLKRAGVWVGGAEAQTGKPCWDEKLTGPLALAVGSEGRGLSAPIRKHCDFLMHVPLFGQVNSLNVSVATAVLCFERRRQVSRR